jgi:DNA repair protein RecO (recombination protein O)
MSRELIEVQGIIFKRQKYNEADLLAKIITQKNGILTMIAHGALKPKSKLGAALLNFSHGTYVISTTGQGISSLRTYKNIRQFDRIFNNLTMNAYASFILDLIDHAFVEYQNVGKYYDLAEFALQKIVEQSDPEMISQIVQMQLLAAYGVEPELHKCVVCGEKNGEFDYSIKYGGILCKQHFYMDTHRLHLQPKQTAVLRTIGLVPFQRLGTIIINKDTKKATRRAIDQIYQETIDLNLKTKKFLDELNLLP